MENDLVLGEEENQEESDEGSGWEYSDYIEAALSALSFLDTFNPMTEPDRKRTENIRKKGLYLISASLDKLVKQFDEEHD